MDKDKEVEKRIEECRKNGGVSLSLGWLGLTSIPEIVFKLLDLEELLLIGNKLDEIPEEILKLSKLRKLYLSNNNLTVFPEVLGKMKQLKFLDLGGNKITSIPDIICDLKELEHFELNRSELVTIPEVIFDLTWLKRLYLDENNISFFPEKISQLVDLEELRLCDNKITYIPDEIGQLTNLKIINLYKNKLTSIPSALFNLENLEEIDFSANKICSLSNQISQLKKLKELYLYNNHIDFIPSEIGNLNVLEHLELSENSLEYLPITLSKLTSLTDLGLEYNKLICIPDFIGNIKSLKYLNLSSNRLRTISPSIGNLINLEKLHLSYNYYISSIPPAIGNLKSLVELELAENQVKSIPKEIGKLRKLEILDLRWNKIKSIPEELGNLVSWRTFDFSKNLIEVIPESLLNSAMVTKYSRQLCNALNLDNNPLKYPPLHIIKDGNRAMKDFFAQAREQGTVLNNEARVILVGQPAAGKTTLAKKLFKINLEIPDKNQESTLGIEVSKDRIFNSNDRDIIGHIWDFGGQDIQYFLHQFFLTPNSLYILVADYRAENARYDYWFQLLDMLSDGSSVIVVENKMNVTCRSNFPLARYLENYPELKPVHIEIDLKDSDDYWRALVRTISDKLLELPLLEQEVPAIWPKVRERIELLKERNYISLDEFYTICKEEGLSNREYQESLKEHLKTLGVVLYFENTIGLDDFLFINPNWIVRALYSIFKNVEGSGFSSVVERKTLYKHWQALGYSQSECGKLLLLLLKDNFDLCYELPQKGFYLFPLLLSPVRPQIEWDLKGNFNFRYQYPFMPEGIISRLIVRLHNYIEKDGESNQLVWREGVILSYSDSRARVRQLLRPQDGLKTVDISISGGTMDNRKDFLTIIRSELNIIHTKSFKNIRYSELLPCQCRVCNKADDPYYFDFEDIKRYIMNNVDKIECRKGVVGVSIRELCGAVFRDEDNPLNEQKESTKSGYNPVFNYNIRSQYNINEGERNMEVNNPQNCQIIETVSNSEVNFKKVVKNSEGVPKEDMQELINRTIEAMQKLEKEEVEKIKVLYKNVEVLEESKPELAEANKDALNEFAGQALPFLQSLTATAVWEILKACFTTPLF